MKHLFLIIPFFVLSILSGDGLLFAQTRPVHWVHGLNSSSNFWANYKGVFEGQRRIDGAVSTNGDYTTNGVVNFSNQVRAQIPDDGNGIAIGHSMGGLSIRETARFDADNSTNNFGGMIAAGSPLGGAKIFNSIANGTMEAAILDGTDKLGRGPFALTSTVIFMITGVPPGPIASIGLSKKLREILRNMVGGNPELPITVPNAEGFYGAQTFADLKEGSTYMSGINGYSGLTKQRLMIWGNENSPIQWRLASSMTNDDADVAWAAGDDEMFVNYANTAHTLYAAQHSYQVGLAALHYSTLNFPAGAFHTWMANEWNAGKNWLEQSESIWADLIGATTGTILGGYVNTWTQTCSEGEWNQCFPANSPAACMDQCGVYGWVPYYVSVQAGSDGLVSIYSQQAIGTNWLVSNDRLLEAVSVNHHEMRGHPNMTSSLNQAFNRSDFFRTLPW